MAVRGTNTMSEGLQAMLGDIATMKALPDADLQFLIGLETMVLQKLKEPIDSMAGQLGAPGGMPPGAGPVPGMGPGSTPPPMGGGMGEMQGGVMPLVPAASQGGPPMGAPGGPPTGMPMGAGIPNPDELRRLLGDRAGS